VLLRDDIRIRVIHVREEAPIANVVVVARPQLVISIVRAVDYMAIQSDAHDLQTLVNKFICCAQELLRVLLTNSSTFRFPVFLSKQVIQETARQLFVHQVAFLGSRVRLSVRGVRFQGHSTLIHCFYGAFSWVAWILPTRSECLYDEGAIDSDADCLLWQVGVAQEGWPETLIDFFVLPGVL